MKYLLNERLVHDINGVSDENETPLFVAAWCVNSSQVSLLLSRNADVTIRDKWGDSPAHVADGLDSLDVIAEFMNHQCDVEAPDNQDLGCEMIALKHGHTELAATLRKYAEEPSTVLLCLQ